jgi:hypothetical protein
MTSREIEPATFRLVAYRLDELCYLVPPVMSVPVYCKGFDRRVARQQLCKQAPTSNNREVAYSVDQDRCDNRLAG